MYQRNFHAYIWTIFFVSFDVFFFNPGCWHNCVLSQQPAISPNNVYFIRQLILGKCHLLFMWSVIYYLCEVPFTIYANRWPWLLWVWWPDCHSVSLMRLILLSMEGGQLKTLGTPCRAHWNEWLKAFVAKSSLQSNLIMRSVTAWYFIGQKLKYLFQW